MNKIKTTVIFLTALAMFFIASKNSLAADYYVSPAGSASWSACLNINTPCSWQTAMANAVAGDTVYFRGGTYDLGIFANHPSMAYAKMFPINSGIGDPDSQRIIFKAYTGETPVITGTVASNSQENYFGCGERNYITWDGFSATFQHNFGNYESNVFSARGSYCTIKNSNFTGITFNSGINYNSSLIRVEACNNCLVENNQLHDLIGGVNNVAAIWIFGNTGPNTIRNNTITNSSGGIYAKTIYFSPKVYNNFLYNNPNGTVGSYAMRYNYQGASPSGGLTEVYQNVIIWRNTVEQSIIQLGPSFPDSNYSIYNNTIYAPTQSGSSGIILNGSLITGLQVFNNIFQSNNRYVTYASGSVSYSNNNIFYTGSLNSWVLGSNYTSLADWQATGYDLNSYVENPLFSNISGTTPESFKINAVNKNRGRGGVYASVMGAYITGDEIIGYRAPSGSGDTTPPASPTGLTVT